MAVAALDPGEEREHIRRASSEHMAGVCVWRGVGRRAGRQRFPSGLVRRGRAGKERPRLSRCDRDRAWPGQPQARLPGDGAEWSMSPTINRGSGIQRFPSSSPAP